MTTPDLSPRLSSLAHRVAWGRLLPGVALLVVGLSQSVLTVPGVDETVRTAGMLPLLVGAAMTWVAAAGTQDSGRLLRGGAPDS